MDSASHRAATLFFLLLSVLAAAPHSAVAANFGSVPSGNVADCPPPKWMPERLNYYDQIDQTRIRQIEGNHFDSDTENLVHGKTGATPGYDIEFLVRYVPNHPRGLTSLVRLALRDRTPRPAGMSLSVECYLVRALEFQPNDAEVEKIYGGYLARLGRQKEALQHFKNAETVAPNDVFLAYNLGLTYFELKDYAQARAYAQKAYAGGVPFPGLRDKLSRAGQLRE